jgi:hypothetical protein
VRYSAGNGPFRAACRGTSPGRRAPIGGHTIRGLAGGGADGQRGGKIDEIVRMSVSTRLGLGLLNLLPRTEHLRGSEGHERPLTARVRNKSQTKLAPQHATTSAGTPSLIRDSRREARHAPCRRPPALRRSDAPDRRCTRAGRRLPRDRPRHEGDPPRTDHGQDDRRPHRRRVVSRRRPAGRVPPRPLSYPIRREPVAASSGGPSAGP